MAAVAARNALLKHLRVNVDAKRQLTAPFVMLSLNQFRRHFSEEVRGSFLDKQEVADRIVGVVKKFQKCDPSKVLAFSILNWGPSVCLLWLHLGWVELILTLCELVHYQ
ncbi:hypothetical protein MKW94_000240 [Papaver nudicaule]|uniref:Uncharacterized protein n=1 Tax=Papaver nudicaule TaxID=74823 RepID=A0AA41VE60_PAPNU|nr:hypothetical protein [Papaver nudicaule]